MYYTQFENLLTLYLYPIKEQNSESVTGHKSVDVKQTFPQQKRWVITARKSPKKQVTGALFELDLASVQLTNGTSKG